MANRVTRCICYNRSFEEIKKYAEDNNITSIEELRERDFCSNSCRMCTPYVELTLQNGQTDFYPGEPHRRKSKS